MNLDTARCERAIRQNPDTPVAAPTEPSLPIARTLLASLALFVATWIAAGSTPACADEFRSWQAATGYERPLHKPRHAEQGEDTSDEDTPVATCHRLHTMKPATQPPAVPCPKPSRAAEGIQPGASSLLGTLTYHLRETSNAPRAPPRAA